MSTLLALIVGLQAIYHLISNAANKKLNNPVNNSISFGSACPLNGAIHLLNDKGLIAAMFLSFSMRRKELFLL